MIPKVVHLTAKTKKLTWEENRLMKKNQKLLKGYEFVLHDDSDNEKMVAEHFPQYYEKYQSISKGVAKADVARVMYMYIWGGWYIDTDYRFFKDPAGLKEMESATVVLPISREPDKDDVFRLGNAIYGSAPKQKFWLDFLETIFSSTELSDLKENRIEKVTGPEGVTAFYKKQLSKNIISELYPGLITPNKAIFHPSKGQKGFYGKHYCWGSWRTKNLHVNLKSYIKRKLQAL